MEASIQIINLKIFKKLSFIFIKVSTEFVPSGTPCIWKYSFTEWSHCGCSKKLLFWCIAQIFYKKMDNLNQSLTLILQLYNYLMKILIFWTLKLLFKEIQLGFSCIAKVFVLGKWPLETIIYSMWDRFGHGHSKKTFYNQ